MNCDHGVPLLVECLECIQALDARTSRRAKERTIASARDDVVRLAKEWRYSSPATHELAHVELRAAVDRLVKLEKLP